MRAGVSIVILAGGASARMGRPKALLPFGGETLVERAVRRLEPLADDLVVVAAAHLSLPSMPSARLVLDEEPFLGPAAGIAYGLRAATGNLVLVCAVDLPFVRPALFGLLSRRVGEHDGAMPLWSDHPQPLVAVYRRELVETFEAIRRSQTPRAVAILERARVALVPPAEVAAVDPEGRSFLDVDTPAAYEQALGLRDLWDD